MQVFLLKKLSVNRLVLKKLATGVALSCLIGASLPVLAQNTSVPAGVSRYQPTAFPDRIILLPTASPADSQTVNWRTNAAVAQAEAEIIVADATPGLHLKAQAVRGTTAALTTENGLGHHHQVTFSNLKPDTLYAYRVKGQQTWSEWLQFRTASSEGFTPFSLIYLGDAQNALKSHFSRTVRQAFMQAPQAKLMIHAGDLVNSRSGNLDDEWGEWFDAGSWPLAMVNQVVASGNHEYIKVNEDTPQEYRQLVPQYSKQFGIAQNGPEGFRDTAFYTDYQGVRFIVLNSTEATDNEAQAIVQAKWLKQVLQNNKSRWTIVVYHHPMVSVSKGRDNPILRKHWQPLLEQYGVDLVLQGHDHTYGRYQPKADTLPEGQGPVYVVSVAGPKMYLVSDYARNNMAKVAEDTQLYQVINIATDKLSYESRTVTGQLYDAFTLERQKNGSKVLKNVGTTAAERHCGNDDPAARADERCWQGTAFGPDDGAE